MPGKPGSTKPVLCMNVAGPWTFDLDTIDVQKRHVIDAVGQLRHQAADPLATLAVLLPRPTGFSCRRRGRSETARPCRRIERLTVALDQLGFVVEGVALAGGAGHEQLHDALGLGRVMQAAVEFGPALAAAAGSAASRPSRREARPGRSHRGRRRIARGNGGDRKEVGSYHFPLGEAPPQGFQLAPQPLDFGLRLSRPFLDSG